MRDSCNDLAHMAAASPWKLAPLFSPSCAHPSGATPPRSRTCSAVAARRQSPETNKSLIATPPRLEIVTTYSFQGRKLFLIATRPGVSCSSEVPIWTAKPGKINRYIELLESLVCRSKHRTGPRINRDISRGLGLRQKFFSSLSSVATAFQISHSVTKFTAAPYLVRTVWNANSTCYDFWRGNDGANNHA